MYVILACMKKCCDPAKNSIWKFWRIYTVLNYLNTNMCFLGCCLSACKNIRIIECLVSAWTVERILFMFGVQEITHPRSVPGEYELSSSKSRGPSCALRNTKWRLSRKQLERFWLNFDYLSRQGNKVHRWYFQENKTVCPLWIQRRNANFLQTGFICQMDVIVSWHLASSNGVTNNNRFRLQSNAYWKVCAKS
jgi:hypothetical protein